MHVPLEVAEFWPLNKFGKFFRCSFLILASNGFLHHVEISPQPAASISSMSTSKSGLTVKRQFPKDVYCFDYDPEHSLLLVVGSADSNSLMSTGNTGMVQ